MSKKLHKLLQLQETLILYRKHRDFLELDSPSNDAHSEDEESSSGIHVNVDQSEPEVNHLHVHRKQMALFLLKTKEVRKVSQTTLDGIIDDVSSIVQLTIDDLHHEVDVILKRNGLDDGISTFHDLEDLFENTDKREPFRDLSSRYLQEKFYKEHLDLLVS